jgi:hypothetical protein
LLSLKLTITVETFGFETDSIFFIQEILLNSSSNLFVIWLSIASGSAQGFIVFTTNIGMSIAGESSFGIFKKL